jgi:hypothetical protein
MDKQATIKGLPGGRPRKDTRTLRDQWLKARVTADELHLVEQRAREAKLTQSDYVRTASLQAPIVIKRFRTMDPVFLHDLARLAQEISRAGNVVNQVARIAHTVGDLRRGQLLDAALEDLNRLVEEIRPLLKRLHELQ